MFKKKMYRNNTYSMSRIRSVKLKIRTKGSKEWC